MARTQLTVHELEDRNKFSADIATLTAAVDAAEGAEFAMSERDDKYLVLIQNAGSAAKKATIKHGNGIQGVCDLECEIAANSYRIVSLDSGRFKNVTGKDKGKVVITGASADVKVAVFRLP